MIKAMSLKRLILFVSFAISLQPAVASENSTTDRVYPAFNFSDWPNDVIEPLKAKLPELTKSK